MRAHSLGYIEKGPYTYLWKQLSARGYRLREPPELDFPQEEPEVLERMIRLYLNSFGYSLGELAKLFCVHESELQGLYGITGSVPRRAKLSVLK